MFKYILLIACSLQLYALQLRVDTAIQHSEFYSILYLSSSQPFICEKRDVNSTAPLSIICAFTKKPHHIFKNLSNNYFSIAPKIKDNIFFIIIKPKYKMFMRSMPFDLILNQTVFQTNIKIARRWMIIGYKNSLPLINEKSHNGLNFPITFSNMKLAYVGGLDLSGKPIHIKQLKNIKYYISIKQAYKDGQYTKTLSLIDEALRQYPYSMFNSLYMYDKIKILYKMADYHKLLVSSEQFLRKYSGNAHTADILLLTADSNEALKHTTEAKYFYNRLLTEHKNSKFAKLALIKIGDMLLSHHKKQQAVDKYIEALDRAKDINVASLAAYKIALFSLKNKILNDGIKYINKVLNANPSFFAKEPKKALNISQVLAGYKNYKLALKITDIALDTLKPSNKFYSSLLKNKGIWLANTKNKSEAVKVFNRYIKEFPNSKYIDTVKEAKYALFFNNRALDTAQKLRHYDYLIKMYKGKSIAKKALEKKVQLLYKTKQYLQILSLNIKGFDDIMLKSAQNLMQEMVIKHHCYKAVEIYKRYKLVAKYPLADNMYQCAMQTLSYKTAHKIAKQFVSSKDISKRIKWMYYDALSLYHLKHYHKVLQIGDDLSILLQNNTKSPYDKIYRVMFDSYAKLHNHEKMLSSMQKIINIFSIRFKDISRYIKLVRLGVSLKDNNIIITYGKYVYKLQNRYKTYPYSPYIEFTLAQAYSNIHHVSKAIKILLSLKSLAPLQKSRQQYLLGTLFEKKWKNQKAIDAFKASIKADKSSPWAQLSKDAINLL